MDSQQKQLLALECSKACRAWRKRHFIMIVLAALVVLAAEVGMFFALRWGGQIVGTTFLYVYKYVLIPSFTNFFLISLCWLLCRFVKSETVKNYLVSFTMLAVALLIMAVHCLFQSLGALCIPPILCATFYGDRRLAGRMTLGTLAGMLLIAFLPPYDHLTAHDPLYLYNIALYLLIALCVYGAGFFSIGWENRRRMELVDRDTQMNLLENMALRDELTGVPNRLAMRRCFDKLLQSNTENYWVALLDVDHFKFINDTYGHLTGDAVLQGIGQLLQGDGTPPHRVFRYGGDEFCLIFLAETAVQAKAHCQTVLEEIRHMPPPTEGARRCTVSIGLTRHEAGEPIHALIRRTDQAMYYIKRSGDNVMLYEDLPESEKEPVTEAFAGKEFA